MAMSGGTLALVLGAVGVGGYVLYRKAQAKKPSACESLLKTGANLVGNDLLPGIDDTGAAKLLCGAGSSLPGLASGFANSPIGTTLTSINQAIFGNATEGKSARNGICTSCCPAGSQPDPYFSPSDDAAAAIRLHSGSNPDYQSAWAVTESEAKLGGICRDAGGAIVGSLWNDGTFRSYVPPTEEPAPPPVVPVASLETAGGTGTRVAADTSATDVCRGSGYREGWVQQRTASGELQWRRATSADASLPSCDAPKPAPTTLLFSGFTIS